MNKKLLILYILSGGIYFIQGIEALPMLSITLWMKENLHYTPSQIMYIGSFIGLAWLIKPLFGFFVDNWFTNKSFIKYSLLGSIVLYSILLLVPQIPVVFLIFALMLASSCSAVRDISIDGVTCTEGKKENACGNLQAIQWGCQVSSGILVGLIGGYLAEHYSYKIGFIPLIGFYLICLFITKKYNDNNIKKKVYSIIDTITSYKKVFFNKKFIFCCVFLLLYNFSPRFGMALFFIQRDTFHWSAEFIGIIGSIETGLAILSCILYFKMSKRINIRKCFIISCILSFICNIVFLYYTPITAIVYIGYGLFSMFFHLNCMNWMALNTIKGKETTSFAVLCAIANIAGFLSNVSGAWLLDVVGLNTLIIIASFSSFLCLPLLFFKKNNTII